MAIFEITIPALPGTLDDAQTHKIEAKSWLLALRTAVRENGENGESLNSIMCEARPDGEVIIREPITKRMFRIREIGEGSIQ